ncbi:MAG: hypothetical protein GKR98_15885 [Boseongicola sp.]|nr:MAG: hypothetical protein GKR98_15885 [Boseongicola sp.]
MTVIAQTRPAFPGSNFRPIAKLRAWNNAVNDYHRFKRIDDHLLADMGFTAAQQDRSAIRDFFFEPR